MTREEAIKRIGDIKRNYKRIVEIMTDNEAEALDMAIKALEQKPKTIQERQAESEKYQKAFEDGYEQGYAQAKFDYEQEPCRDMEEIREVMGCDADAETKCKMISNILTAKPHYFEKQQPCEDAISRQAVLNILFYKSDNNSEVRLSKELRDRIKNLPSVKPQSKTGHWFVDERPQSDREIICSNCEQPIFRYHKLDFDYRPKYCPNCGAKMESEEV